ncbi:hypothetical protein ACPAY5_05440 [Staphylococcus caledonicus]|uniref:hypothetical protein n=1 Tax=Staphylococcus caledonicus TaxID=2741333 RepID=UPI003C2E2D5E
MIITYTVANKESLEKKIIEKFSYCPNNIKVFKFFEFLYSFCFRPFYIKNKINGISFDKPFAWSNNYFNKNNQIYSNHLSKLILEEDLNYLSKIEKYFDHLYIDEVQDLHSDDFDWLLTLSKLNIPVTVVGDFYQSTFATSRRGNKNSNLYTNYDKYKKKFEQTGFYFDDSTFNKSHRCPKNITTFVTQKLEIEMDSQKNIPSEINYINNQDEISYIMANNNIKKLFYQNSSKYIGNCSNWGNSKGQEFNNVCVVLNPQSGKLFPDKLNKLATTTLKKFYVACTRTKNNLYFIDEKLIPNEFKIKI